MKKLALITGATKGIGYELAKIFARNGHDCVLIGRSEKRLLVIQQELESEYGCSVYTLSMDLSHGNAAYDIVSFLEREKILVDILVNNAGLGDQEFFEKNDEGRLKEMMAVNIVSLTLLTRLILPGMIQKGRGRILMVASIAGFFPGPTMAAYFASKAYVLSLSESLANEVMGRGITVTALCPGSTRTAFFKNLELNRTKYMDPCYVAERGYRALMKGRRIEIPGIKNKLLVFLGSLIPRSLRLGIVRSLLN